MSQITPCIGICRLNGATGLCEGCHRSLTEIAEWLNYSDRRKRQILEQLPARRPVVARRPMSAKRAG